MCRVLVHIDFEEFDRNFDMVTQINCKCKINSELYEKNLHDEVTPGATFVMTGRCECESFDHGEQAPSQRINDSL